jgi:protein-L-isoaspartate(D-aspartate) O-methyltransferase
MQKIFCFALISVTLFGSFCMSNDRRPGGERKESEEPFAKKRYQMVEIQIKARGIQDERVLDAMRMVPRHKFVPEEEVPGAYNDNPLPIGYGQTISQPYIVGYMSEMLSLGGTEKVLEIGTGSGYQAAVLSVLTKEVYSIEIVEPLCRQARTLLNSLGYKNVSVRCGDGYQGWPEYAPFDAIIITAAAQEIPEPLVEELKPGGRLIMPVGSLFQELVLLRKGMDGKIQRKRLIPVRFVPLTGEAEK